RPGSPAAPGPGAIFARRGALAEPRKAADGRGGSALRTRSATARSGASSAADSPASASTSAVARPRSTSSSARARSLLIGSGMCLSRRRQRPQVLAQGVQGTVLYHPDGAFGLAEDAPDLGVAHALDEAHHHDLLLVVIEPPNRLAQLVPVHAGHD